MIEVEIKDFQSIAHETVRLDGFTAVVGRSNIGKSAVVRAVKAALTGAPADPYVRHGELCLRLVKGGKTCKCFCSVHVKGDGFDLLWEKGDDVNRYEFNGQRYDDPGRGMPDFLGAAGFDLVKIGTEKRLLQVSDQFKPLFLLDESGTVVADVLSDVAQLDQINQAMRLVEKDRRDAAATRKLREKDVVELKKRVSDFDGLDEVLARLRAVRDGEQAILTHKAKTEQLAKYTDTVYGVARRVRDLEKGAAIEIPAVSDLLSASRSYDQLRKFITSTADKQAAITRLSGVETINPPAIEPFKDASKAFVRLDGWVLKVRAFKDFFTRCKDVEAIEPPTPAPLVELATRLQTLVSLHTKHIALGKAVQTLGDSEKMARAEEAMVKAESDALGVCPTCSRPIIDAHAHAMGA